MAIARGLAPRDPFIEQFFSRLPPGASARFTNRQLAALKSVFGDATHNGHLVNLRLNLRLPLRKSGSYLVLILGRDRRAGKRPAPDGRRPFARLGNVLMGIAFVAQFAIALAVIFYLVV